MSIDQPDWKNLRHAYGSAEDLPSLLDSLEPDPGAPVWHELISRVCHQYSTFSASPHVLPFLLSAASAWAPDNRTMPLTLAGAIVAARETNLEGYHRTVEQLHALALETLRNEALPRPDRVYLLQASMAFEGDRLWGHALERLNDGEFNGECPACRSAVLVEVDDDAFFCTAEDQTRTEVSPRKPDELPGAGLTLHARCIAGSDRQLAQTICRLFGSAICPKCGTLANLPDVVACEGL